MLKRYYTTALDGRTFEHPDGPFVRWAEHEAEVAAWKAKLSALWNVLAKNDKLFNEACAAVDALRAPAPEAK